ncbi:hypothetical protein [Phenylobacterium sp.]|uniref:hypothetical protein n=1 Tax=Phenylobacterium sp. TaxID=1871053 RepID=UPI002733B104|nr:hypothetical protein [Phenylobacterium sp.]MDP3852981.1 hypothetical protein [Phenylobacterium sp.]
MAILQDIRRLMGARRDDQVAQRVVKTVSCADGTRFLEIAEREDGLYRYIEHCKQSEHGMMIWKSGALSDLHQSLAAAEQAARDQLCWLTYTRKV